MKRIALSAAALALALAACSQKQATEAEKPAAAPAGGSEMAGMSMSGEAMMAKGSGTVTAVDTAKGTVTIDHGPIAEANWPAMTMAFKAAPDVVGQVKAGDKVAFDLKLQGGAGEVTAIQKQ
jgi:Cu(I)/Ag(I) efflux system periplasmic protein CusF